MDKICLFRTLRMSVRLFACSIRLLARLYFLYSARLTLDRCISNYVLSFLSAALAQTLLFYLCLYFLFVFYFIFILFLRTGSASLPLRHVCDNDHANQRAHRPKVKTKSRLLRVWLSRLFCGLSIFVIFY